MDQECGEESRVIHTKDSGRMGKLKAMECTHRKQAINMKDNLRNL